MIVNIEALNSGSKAPDMYMTVGVASRSEFVDCSHTLLHTPGGLAAVVTNSDTSKKQLLLVL